MDRKLVSKIISVEGMTCSSCEFRIEKKLKDMAGIVSVRAAYNDSTVYVTYNAAEITMESIMAAIEELDYKVRREMGEPSVQEEKKTDQGDRWSINQILGIGIILLAVFLIVKNTIGFNFIPEISQDMGYGILFVIGLMTSLHCIAMCGGINLSQCMRYNQGSEGSKYARLKPSLLYNGGRVVSYTVIGGIVGLIGKAVSFSGAFKGTVAIVSGLFMVIMGLNLLNIFPWLRKLNPRMPKFFGQKVHAENKRGPFYVGILNGLMPCGPLQAMQVYALGTGSFLAGAFSMFMFSLGTVPLMFGFGALSSLLSGKFTKRMMKLSALLVMFLGVIMVSRGLNLSGIAVYADTGTPTNAAVVQDGVQMISTDLESGSYPTFVVQKGVPVKWNMKVEKKNLNGCNNELVIPEFGLQQKLRVGDNFIEFTPTEEGIIPYTCWMGMIRGNIKVVDDMNVVDFDTIKDEIDQLAPPAAPGMGGCCGI